MRRYITFIIFGIIFSIAMAANEKESIMEYLKFSDLCYSQNDMSNCIINLYRIQDAYKDLPEDEKRDFDVCDALWKSYEYVALWDKSLSLESKINIYTEAFSLLHKNPIWVKQLKDKYEVIEQYKNCVRACIEKGDKEYAKVCINEMIAFADEQMRSNINEVLLEAYVFNDLMDEHLASSPLMHRLYDSWGDLDKIQQWTVLKYLIHEYFCKKDYDHVIMLGRRHKSLFNWTKDDIKGTIAYFVSSSYEKIADAYAKQNGSSFSEVVAQSYSDAVYWNREMFPPMYASSLVCYGFYLYQYEDKKQEAVELFKLHLKTINETIELDDDLFNRNYDIVEYTQQALISIIMVDVIKKEEPEDLKEILNKYSNIVGYLLSEKCGDYYNDLLEVIDYGWSLCYGQ